MSGPFEPLNGHREQDMFAVHAAFASDSLDEAVCVGGGESEDLLFTFGMSRMQINFAHQKRRNLGTAETTIQRQQQKQSVKWLAVAHQQSQLIQGESLDLLQAL